MILKLWDAYKSIYELSFDTAPVWVQLPGLRPRLWTAKSLSKIVNFIGTLIATDRMTAQRSLLDFVRVLVEVNTKKELPKEIPISGPGGMKLVQPVVYEWKMKK